MTDYLNFDSDSILTKLKLNIQNSDKYSDQLFPGSNLSILLETISLMFENLTYITNSEATQASFGDTTIYESINKLVKKLGYNPRGPISAITGSTEFVVKTDELEGIGNSTKVMNKYIRFKPPVGKEVDSDGVNIYYALDENYQVLYNRHATPTEGKLISDNPIIFYNGTWTKHGTKFSSAGLPNETYEINLNQETDPVSDLKIYAYYKLAGSYYEYKAVRNLFDYSAEDLVFEIRVNEDKTLTVRFGDGTNGSILPKNVEIFFVYLRSNGIEGAIGKDLVNDPKESVLDFGIEGIDEPDVLEMLGINPSDTSYIVNDSVFQGGGIYATIDQVSTAFLPMETLEEIKTNAPIAFRSGGRLITEQDFVNYIVQYYSDSIHSSIAMNNWEYMATFHKWLYDNSALNSQIASLGYVYADSCDFNNVYLWVQANSAVNTVSNFIKGRLDNVMKPIKALTSETIFLDPIKNFITPYIGDIPVDIASNENWPDSDNTKIRIVKDPNSLVSIENIRSQTVKVFEEYFNYLNNSLGQTINASDLFNSILAINGVYKVQTVKGNTVIDGISLARWSNTFVEGSDFVTFTGSSKLHEFQFPFFYNIDNVDSVLEVVDANYSSGGVEF